MASELQKQILHFLQSPEHVVSLDGTARSLQAVLGGTVSEDDAGPVTVLPQSSGDDTRHRLVAVLQVDHLDVLIRIQLLRLAHCLLRPLVRHPLPLVVQELEMLRRLLRLLRIRLQEHAEPHLGTLQPPARVQARADDKADMEGGKVLRIQPAELRQLPEPHILRPAHSLQTFPHHLPVLFPQRHHITHRGDGRERQELHPFFPGDALPFIQDSDQLPGHCRTADIPKGVGAVRALRVHHCVRLREQLPAVFPVAYLMVVRHDDSHSQPLCLPDLLQGRDPVVTGQDGIRPFFLRPSDQVHVQAVAVLDPVRNVVVRLRPDLPQTREQDIGGTDPVDVVVPDHPDLPVSVPFSEEDLRRPVHVLKEQRIRQMVQRSVQVFVKFLFIHSPVHHEPRQIRGNGKAGR